MWAYIIYVGAKGTNQYLNGVGNIRNLNSTGAIHQSSFDAGATKFIEEFPHKYETFLGYMPGQHPISVSFAGLDDSDSDEEDEYRDRVQKDLSGGQWQKIALARALMRQICFS